MSKKILILGTRTGYEMAISKVSAEESYHTLRSMGIYADLDYVRGIKEVMSLFKMRKYDKVLLYTYGDWGNNGTIQKMLDNMGVNYTFSSAEANKLMYNKESTKEFLRKNKIRTPDTYTPDTIIYPCITKPVSKGLSSGVSVVKSADNMNWQKDFMVEEFLCKDDWDEYTVAMFNGVLGMPIFIHKTGDIWGKNISEDIDEYSNKEQIRDLFTPVAEKLDKKLGYKDCIRVDFCVNKSTEEVCVIEINGMPFFNRGGFVIRSMFSYDEKFTYENMLLEMIKT